MSMNREDGGSRPPGGAAFLLAQLGAHAAARFGERIAGLDLTPAQAGVLRLLASTPGRSQRGLIERRRNPRDRRLYALHLTDEGLTLLSELREVAAAHEQQICQALNPEEHEQLRALLGRMAAQQGLSPGVHPGYRWIRPDRIHRPREPLTSEESPNPDRSGTD
jgi:hypothetical protein